MIELAVSIIVYVTFLLFAARRLLTYLHALQQDDYYNFRLLRWLVFYRAFDKRLTAGLLGLTFLWRIVPMAEFFMNCLVFGAFAVTTYLEKDPSKDSKKKLVITPRARRIYWTAMALSAGSGLFGLFGTMPVFWIFLVQLIPFLLVLANLALQPYEHKTQRKFYDEAKRKLNNIKPQIIGITGSYGKTSVKHILGHILKTTAPTLITPGSVNTLMGITRIIREQLEPNHKYFIVEMGAYGPGSIKSLCNLTPPDMGIISAIGHAHYERFKTLDTVAQAKFELAEAVIENNGDMIIHESTLRFSNARAIKSSHVARFTVCGEPAAKSRKGQKPEIKYLADGDLHIQSIRQKQTGLVIKIEWKGEEYTLTAPLYGIHHGHNIALAFAAGVKLGIAAEDIITALQTTPQIPHRLEVKKFPGGGVLIDDAYNSNPIGFRAALDLLALLKGRGRSILVTPGIVELGPLHREVHHKLGILAAEMCDIVLLVQPKRIPSFIKGFQESGQNKLLLQFQTFSEAQAWIQANSKPGDAILLENDLPDIYERVPRI